MSTKVGTFDMYSNISARSNRISENIRAFWLVHASTLQPMQKAVRAILIPETKNKTKKHEQNLPKRDDTLEAWPCLSLKACRDSVSRVEEIVGQEGGFAIQDPLLPKYLPGFAHTSDIPSRISNESSLLALVASQPAVPFASSLERVGRF